MALTSSIVIDLAAQTAALTCLSGINNVEIITYTKSTNQTTFALRLDTNLTASEFIEFGNQVNIFQTAILFNFSPIVSATIPFNSTNVTETHDTVGNKWNFVCIFGATPRLANYSANGANLTVDLFNRANAKIIDFSEWMVFLGALNHYRLSVRNFLGL